MDKITVPVVTPRPSFKLTDSGQDLHIVIDRLGNYVAETLVAIHLLEEQGPQTITLRPTLHEWFRELHLNIPGPIPTPEISFSHKTFQDINRELPKSLFFSGVTQLVSCYEVYLGSLAGEIYRYNPALLAAEERQLTSSQVIKLGSYEEIIESLISRAVSNLMMLSYPNLVQRFNREFHVGIHHENSPVRQFEMHHLVEQRNVIVHDLGYVSSIYHKRMSIYEGEIILEEKAAILIDFKQFFDWLFMVAELFDYIDREVQVKWNTTATS